MKFNLDALNHSATQSPSTRREWIEMPLLAANTALFRSPSTRREWIEILTVISSPPILMKSPSTRREWIEIRSHSGMCEKVDGLPPRGGSGLK